MKKLKEGKIGRPRCADDKELLKKRDPKNNGRKLGGEI